MSDAGLIELASGGARATIATLGAEWRRWRVDGADLLWTPDPAFWDATAPVLFPVCGWTRGGRARVGDRTFPLGLHGFARAEPFEVVAAGADFVRLVLRDNPATRAQYPFSFSLTLDYRLAPARLSVAATARNTGDGPMPHAFGLHPGFRWPLAGGTRADCAIRFDRPERPAVPVIAPGGLFSARTRPVAFADARTLPLSDATFEREALCFLDTASTGFELVGPAGRVARVETAGLPHIVLWSRPGAPFVCLESWSGHGDPEDFDGDLFAKPSMTILAPGDEARYLATYETGGD